MEFRTWPHLSLGPRFSGFPSVMLIFDDDSRKNDWNRQKGAGKAFASHFAQ